MEERELLRRCIDGDREAWSAFTAKYHRLVEYVIVGTLKSYHAHYDQNDIEDIGGDVYAFLLDRDCRILRRYDPKYPFTNWLSMISRARTIDHYRKRKHLRLLKSSAGTKSGDRETDIIDSMAVARDEAPDAVPQRAEIREIVDRALADLPPRDRTILKLFFFEEKKYREIAEIFGISVSMVASNIYRAKMKVTKKLQKELL